MRKGQEYITLVAGDSIFVNENVIHGIRQLSGILQHSEFYITK